MTNQDKQQDSYRPSIQLGPIGYDPFDALTRIGFWVVVLIVVFMIFE